MKTSSKLWLIAAAVLAALFLLLAVFVVTFDANRYRDSVLSRLETALGRPVRASSLTLRLLPPRLELQDVQVLELERFGKGDFLSAQAVRVDLVPGDLWKGRISLSALELIKPVLRLRQNRSGNWNFADSPLITKSGAAPAKGSAASQLPARWEITDARLIIEPRGRPALTLSHLDAQLSGLSTEQPASFQVVLSLPPRGRIEGNGTLGPMVAAGISGILLSARIELKQVASSSLANLLPLPQAAGRLGTLDGSLNLQASRQRIEFQGQVRATGSGAQEPLDIALKAGMRRGSSEVRIESLTFEIPGALPRVSGLIRWSGEPSQQLELSLEVSGSRISPLQKIAERLNFLPARLPGLQGSLDAELGIAGPFNEWNLSGTASMKDLSLPVSGSSQPLKVPRAEARLSPHRLDLTVKKARMGKSDLQGDFSLDYLRNPRLNFALSGERLDVVEVQSLYATSMNGRRKGGSGGADVSKQSWLERLEARGTIRYKRVENGTLLLAPFSGTFTLGKGILEGKPLEFGINGGSARGDLKINLIRSPAVSEFSGSMSNVDVNHFLSNNSSYRDVLFGRLSGQLEMNGRGLEKGPFLESVSGKGTVQLRDGRLTSVNLSRELGTISQLAGFPAVGKETPIDEAKGDFTIQNGWVRSQNLLLKTPDLTMTAEGGFSFQDRLSLDATAAFTVEASRKIREGGLLGRLTGNFFRDSEGRVVIPFKVSGSFSRPQVSLDAVRLLRLKVGGQKGTPDTLLKRLLDQLARPPGGKPPD